MDFDEILRHIGVFGRFQKQLYAVVCIRTFCGALVTLSHVFLAGKSDHWCRAPELDIVNCSHWSLNNKQCSDAKKTVSIPLSTADNSAYEYANCIRYNLTGIEPADWYPDWVTSDVTNNTLECDAGWMYDTDQFHATIITDFDLVCNKQTLPDLAQSMFFVGVLIASLPIGAISDRIGRCRTLIVALILGVVCTFMSALSSGYIMFIILRACFGATFFSANVVGFTLKFVSPPWRVFVGNLLNFFWAGGFMLLAGLGYLIRGWRVLLLVLTLFPLLMLSLIPFLSESPRWLISKGRMKEATKVIQKVAKVNKKKLPDEFFNNLEHQDQNVMNQDNKPLRQASVFDLFSHRYLRFKTLVLLFIWFITTMVYYGLSLSAGDLGVDFYLSFFISGAVEIPAYIYVMFSLDWLGRKPNLSGSLLLGGITCLVSVLVPSGVWKTTVAMIGKFFITITFAIVFIFTVEQFPTLVRNAALGLTSSSGRLGSVLAPIIFIIQKYWTPLPFVVFGIMSIISGLLALLLPETKGKNLPQTIEEGEQFGKDKDTTTNQSNEEIKTRTIGIQVSYDNPSFISE